MTEAAPMLLERLKQTRTQTTTPAASGTAAALAEKPIGEEILELIADVTYEEWDKLPSDLSEQHNN